MALRQTVCGRCFDSSFYIDSSEISVIDWRGMTILVQGSCTGGYNCLWGDGGASAM